MSRSTTPPVTAKRAALLSKALEKARPAASSLTGPRLRATRSSASALSEATLYPPCTDTSAGAPPACDRASARAYSSHSLGYAGTSVELEPYTKPTMRRSVTPVPTLKVGVLVTLRSGGSLMVNRCTRLSWTTPGGGGPTSPDVRRPGGHRLRGGRGEAPDHQADDGRAEGARDLHWIETIGQLTVAARPKLGAA